MMAYLLYESDGTSPVPRCKGVALAVEDAEQWKRENRDPYLSRQYYMTTLIEYLAGERTQGK